MNIDLGKRVPLAGVAELTVGHGTLNARSSDADIVHVMGAHN
jgi:hypothetical protein